MSHPDAHARTAQRARESARIVLRGMALNAVLAVAKFAGGIFGHTYALIAAKKEQLIALRQKPSHTSRKLVPAAL